MSIDYKRFLNIDQYELNQYKINPYLATKYVKGKYNVLYEYLHTKRVKNKKLSSQCNKILLDIIFSMIIHKEPYKLIGLYENIRFQSNFIHYIDNVKGTILSIQTNKKCKACRKNIATYTHVNKSNCCYINQDIICGDCLQDCVHSANYFIAELAYDNMIKYYMIFKQTNIYQNLVKDISYIIFYLSLH